MPNSLGEISPPSKPSVANNFNLFNKCDDKTLKQVLATLQKHFNGDKEKKTNKSKREKDSKSKAKAGEGKSFHANVDSADDEMENDSEFDPGEYGEFPPLPSPLVASSGIQDH